MIKQWHINNSDIIVVLKHRNDALTARFLLNRDYLLLPSQLFWNQCPLVILQKKNNKVNEKTRMKFILIVLFILEIFCAILGHASTETNNKAANVLNDEEPRQPKLVEDIDFNGMYLCTKFTQRHIYLRREM